MDSVRGAAGEWLQSFAWPLQFDAQAESIGTSPFNGLDRILPLIAPPESWLIDAGARWDA
jgi:hypothetical protein